MATFQGLLFLGFGLGLLLLIYRSLSTRALPCGPNGIKGRLEFKRGEQPLAYWLMFGLYGAAGGSLLVFGLRLLIGLTAPLPLR